MLMIDRIALISDDGGKYGKGEIRAELDIKPDLWFFQCHFEGDPVMPGCLGLDAMWQLVGFHLVWLGSAGSRSGAGRRQSQIHRADICRRRSSSPSRSTSSASYRAGSTWRSPTALCPSTVAKSIRPKTCGSDFLPRLKISRIHSCGV